MKPSGASASHKSLGVAPISSKFSAAYNGPREKVGAPIRKLVPTPTGSVVQEIHTKNDELAWARNRQRDRFASGAERVKTSTSREFNFRARQGATPENLPPVKTPQVFADAKAKRRAALKARLLAKEFEKARDNGPRR